MKRFDDQVALITGGASGIGRALAEQLCASGATCVLADIDGTKAEDVATALRRAGGHAFATPLDVTDAESFDRVVEAVCTEHGRLDLLFNNAGIVIIGEAHELSLDDWLRTLEVDLDGVVHGIHAAYPRMIANRHGHIVNTASLAGLAPSPGIVPYAAAKHGVVGLSMSLRAEAAAYGVKVSAVCPGVIRTPIVENAPIRGELADALPAKEAVFDALPVTPQDVGRAASTILRGVARNRALILVTPHAHVFWRLYRLAPWLGQRLARRAAAAARRQLGVS